jgi:hypothetical protein
VVLQVEKQVRLEMEVVLLVTVELFKVELASKQLY